MNDKSDAKSPPTSEKDTNNDATIVLKNDNDNNNNNDDNNTNEIDSNKTDLNEIKINFLIEACGIDKKNINQTNLKNNLLELEPFIEEEKQIKKPLGLIFVMWAIVSLFAVLRSNVEGCSILYWIITVFVFPFLFLLTFVLSKKQVINYQNKLKYGWIPCEGDVEWNNYKKALIYSCVAGIAGILGGLLGIGGGMIVSPLLLELHVLPRVASATSAMAVLVTSSSATLQFLLIDMLSIDYMLFFMSVGILGTYFGQTVVNHCIKKYGRTSVVIFAIGTVIAMAVFFMGIKGIVDIVNGDSPLIFSSLC